MQYIFHGGEFDVLSAHRKVLRGFDSLWVYEISVAEHVVYSLTNLAPILGYRNPQNLKSLLSQADDFLIPMDDLYMWYVCDVAYTYDDACDIKVFVDMLSHLVPDDNNLRFNMRSYFTNIDGILFILSHNTMTSDRVKRALCEALGVDKSIVCPSRPETHFCDRLSSMLTEFGYTIKRQYQMDIYRLDMAIFDGDKFICAVEYDEDTHRWYDTQKEHDRQAYMNRHHVKIFRADTSTKSETICKQILDMTSNSV